MCVYGRGMYGCDMCICMERCMCIVGCRTRSGSPESHIPLFLPLARWTVVHVSCSERTIPVAGLHRAGLGRYEVQQISGARLRPRHSGVPLSVDQLCRGNASQEVMARSLLDEFGRRAAAVPGEVTQLPALEARAFPFLGHRFAAVSRQVSLFAAVHASHIISTARRGPGGYASCTKASTSLR